jgi:hypothetical protein
MPSDNSPEKATEPTADAVEDLHSASYPSGNAASTLSQEHQQYLLDRHGTLDLDPLPGIGGADPYNWPLWKVRSHC